ncbi:hypothetical protein FGO68_gene10232 [Halteria grandinella]|uniref:Uncharacterized protein n=1 Tax=Halteria grandinella TaxID=5974 RepID=A0A8J8NK66_HALGN|nr:hypothetical protein FGO68_gene10232 [Halteria grandinella]
MYCDLKLFPLAMASSLLIQMPKDKVWQQAKMRPWKKPSAQRVETLMSRSKSSFDMFFNIINLLIFLTNIFINFGYQKGSDTLHVAQWQSTFFQIYHMMKISARRELQRRRRRFDSVLEFSFIFLSSYLL